MVNEMQKTEVFTPVVAHWESRPDVSFGDLTNAVMNIHLCSYQSAVKAINRYATMRNWLIGFFIVEYQQKGKDRAVYGERLLKRLEESLDTRGLNVTLFQNCRQFDACYPQVAELFHFKIQPTVLVKLEETGVQNEIQPTASGELVTDGNTLVSRTIKGDTEITGSVFGGGDESAVLGTATVNIGVVNDSNNSGDGD